MIYEKIILNLQRHKKQFALLIDPDKHNDGSLLKTIHTANEANVDFILVGGSIISNTLENTIEILKKNSTIPIIIFPGSLLQISENADAILLLSLISGRNPDFLIGNQVVAAPMLKKSNLEVLSTGYILIESGKTSSVEYMSNTKPIPYDKVDIAVATAIAGEMLGHKLVYIEAGSGAPKPVSSKMISEVKKHLKIPLIAGGGIRTAEDVENVCKAGADILVIGTAIEKEMEKIKKFAAIIHQF
ncbi:MAG: geranylgeranylglyceryl/heptaprenylglyceryl phosphate synthase [Bacteroidia bacterium]|nr:geranylgeranylglyceryl/heptaprenylglyceryl phosphate synthase [Bacteroidia bacterium]